MPSPTVVAGSRLVRITRREQRRHGGLRGLAADEATVRMLGLLTADERLGPATTAGSDLAAAAYDTASDRLYVVRDAVSANRALVEFVLAHELTHAVEDSNYGLAEPHGPSDDRALAELALGEGTATAVMVDYAAGYLSPSDLLSVPRRHRPGHRGCAQFVVDQLEWTYLGGQEFVNELRRLAGGWKLVDYAIRYRPPASTEQVIHPSKYVHDERPLKVGIDPRRSGRPAGGRRPAATSASSRPRSCSSSATTSRTRGAPRPVGAATAMSSGGAMSPVRLRRRLPLGPRPRAQMAVGHEARTRRSSPGRRAAT